MSDKELILINKIYWKLIAYVKQNKGEMTGLNVDNFFCELLGKKDYHKMFEVENE